MHVWSGSLWDVNNDMVLQSQRWILSPHIDKTLFFALLGTTIVWKGERQTSYASCRKRCQDQWISGWSLQWLRGFLSWAVCYVASAELSEASKHTQSFTDGEPGISGTCRNISVCSSEETYEVSLSEHRDSSQKKVSLIKSRLWFCLLRAYLGMIIAYQVCPLNR